MQENRIESNGWLFEQGHFIASSTHEYCTGVNGRGMQRASDFENALIFTGAGFENALNFNEIFCINF